MASPIGPIQISVGDIVEYQERCCVVQAIDRPMGFNIYTIQDLVDSTIIKAHIHQLDKPEYLEMVDGAIDGWTASSNASTVDESATATVPVESNTVTESACFDTPPVTLWRFEAPLKDSVQTENICSGPTPPKRRRHACPSDEELDKLAAARLSHNTDEQTRWGVSIFQGINKNVFIINSPTIFPFFFKYDYEFS